MKASIGKYKRNGKRTVTIEVSKDDVISLYNTIALLMVPLLEVFKEMTISYPLGQTRIEWDEILGKMIKAFKLKIDGRENEDEASRETFDEGMQLFRAYYTDLWI